jgi:ribosomal protein L12E/L44/L45/RPP1/RPP2
MWDKVIVSVITSVVTVALSKGIPWLLQAYDRRYIDPKRAHQYLFLEQGEWYAARAAQLHSFRFDIIHGPKPDKFKLALSVSKLDRKDIVWAMKETDIDLLAHAAAQKAAECEDNAAECARHADEINYRTFIFPIA